VRLRRCPEDEEEAGSDEASVGPAILIPSAGGFRCYRDGGGGPTQGTGFPIMEHLGSHHTPDTHTHGMAIGNTDDTNKK
jgi:hypothetical protein